MHRACNPGLLRSNPTQATSLCVVILGKSLYSKLHSLHPGVNGYLTLASWLCNCSLDKALALNGSSAVCSPGSWEGYGMNRSRQGLNIRSWGNIRLLIKNINLHFNFFKKNFLTFQKRKRSMSESRLRSSNEMKTWGQNHMLVNFKSSQCNVSEESLIYMSIFNSNTQKFIR